VTVVARLAGRGGLQEQVPVPVVHAMQRQVVVAMG
jgi:hypothetical protein